MRIASVLVTASLFTACGKNGGDHDKAPPAPGASGAPVARPPVAEVGPPPKEMYKGKNRLVNLLVDKDGKTQSGDVWVRRGFKFGPVKLAEGVAFGTASAWFGVPEHMSPVFLPLGAKPDDKEISGVAYGKADEIVTGLLMTDGASTTVISLYDKSKEMTQAPKAPAAGKGLVILFAMPLMAFEKGLTEKFGGRSFEVGDGAGACRTPRDPKNASQALGGTVQYELELPPGKAKVSLHKWPGKECKDAVLDFEVEAVADKSTWVVLYSPDAGKTIATLALPLGE